MSYANMVMFSSVLPTYRGNKDKEKDPKHQRIDADDPKNRDLVRKELFG